MLKEYLLDIFKSNDTREYKEWVHYQWEEDGEQFSMWCNGGMCTGDAGYKAILDECHKTAKNYIDNVESI